MQLILTHLTASDLTNPVIVTKQYSLCVLTDDNECHKTLIYQLMVQSNTSSYRGVASPQTTAVSNEPAGSMVPRYFMHFRHVL